MPGNGMKYLETHMLTEEGAILRLCSANSERMQGAHLGAGSRP